MKKQTVAESLWKIAEEIASTLEAGSVPDVTKMAGYGIALGVLARDVEAMAAADKEKERRLRAVTALCSRAEREGVAGDDSFTVDAVRKAATEDPQ